MIESRGKWLVVCLLVLLGSMGCSIKLAYNNLDRLARWQLADYVDFTAAQRTFVDHEIGVLLYWHRTTQLPKYAERVELFADAINQELARGDVEQLFEDLFDYADAVETQGLHLALELMLSLTDAQIAELPARLEKANQEWVEDEVDISVEEIRYAWGKRMIDGMERFAGRLRAEQRAYVRTEALRYKPERVLWAAYRQRWQQDLLVALAERHDRAAFTAQFHELIATRDAYYGDEFRKVSDHNEAVARDIVHGVISRLDDAQLAKFTASLEELAEDFRELAEDAKPPAPQSQPCLAACDQLSRRTARSTQIRSAAAL